MNKEKMIKHASILYTITNIINKVCIIGLVVCVCGAIAATVMPISKLPQHVTYITLGNIQVQLNEASLPELTYIKWHVVIGILAAAIIVGLTYYGTILIKNILSPMKQALPFDGKVSENFKKLSLLVLSGGIVGQVAVFMTETLLMKKYLNLADILNPNIVQNYHTHYSFDLSFLIVALMLYLLANVFEYGRQLQQESDETL